MPEMDELEATSAIRGQDPDALIVIITQNDAEETRHLDESAGAGAFLSMEHILNLPSIVAPH